MPSQHLDAELSLQPYRQRASARQRICGHRQHHGDLPVACFMIMIMALLIGGTAAAITQGVSYPSHAPCKLCMLVCNCSMYDEDQNIGSQLSTCELASWRRRSFAQKLLEIIKLQVDSAA